jgi:hypothetical protein
VVQTDVFRDGHWRPDSLHRSDDLTPMGMSLHQKLSPAPSGAGSSSILEVAGRGISLRSSATELTDFVAVIKKKRLAMLIFISW